MRMGVKSVIVAIGLFAAAVWTPTAIAQRGQGAARRRLRSRAVRHLPGRGGGAGESRWSAQAPAGPAPRLANGKPDLTGLWNNPYTADMAGRGVFDPRRVSR